MMIFLFFPYPFFFFFFNQFQLALLVSYLYWTLFSIFIYLFFFTKILVWKIDTSLYMSEMMTRLFFMWHWCIMIMSWNSFVALALASSFGFRTCFLPYILSAMGWWGGNVSRTRLIPIIKGFQPQMSRNLKLSD